jgi:hypothetical protein
MTDKHPAYFCRQCNEPIHWEQIVTTEAGPGHDHNGIRHEVTHVHDLDMAQFMDDALLWLTVLEQFVTGGNAAKTIAELGEVYGNREMTLLQIKGSYNVGGVMLHFIAGMAGTDLAGAVGLVRGFMLQTRDEAK